MLTVQDVKHMAVDKSKINRDIYKELLHMCYRKIRAKIQMDKKTKSVEFVLPPFIIGKPVYNTRHATRYIIDSLHKGGFRTEVIEDGRLIRVAWGRTHVQKTTPFSQPSTNGDHEQDGGARGRKERVHEPNRRVHGKTDADLF